MKLIEHGLTQRRRHQTHRTEAFSSHPCGDVDVFPKCQPENVWEWMVSPFESKWWYPYYNIAAAISDFRWSNYPWNHLIWVSAYRKHSSEILPTRPRSDVVNAGGKGSSTGAARAITGSGAPREVELGGPGEMGFPIMVQKIVQNNFLDIFNKRVYFHWWCK